MLGEAPPRRHRRRTPRSCTWRQPLARRTSRWMWRRPLSQVLGPGQAVVASGAVLQAGAAMPQLGGGGGNRSWRSGPGVANAPTDIAPTPEPTQEVDCEHILVSSPRRGKPCGRLRHCQRHYSGTKKPRAARVKRPAAAMDVPGGTCSACGDAAGSRLLHISA